MRRDEYVHERQSWRDLDGHFMAVSCPGSSKEMQIQVNMGLERTVGKPWCRSRWGMMVMKSVIVYEGQEKSK